MPDFVVASATATQEEMDHAVSPDWRTPFPVKDETKAEPAKAEGEEVASEASEEAKTAPGSEPEIQQEALEKVRAELTGVVSGAAE